MYMQPAVIPQASTTSKVPLDQVAQPPQYGNVQPLANAQNLGTK